MSKGRDQVAAAKKAWITRRTKAGGVAASPISGIAGGSTSARFDRRLAHELTALDIKESRRELKRMGRENIHRLPLYLQAADSARKAVRGGVSPSAAFASRFNPTRGMHGVAKRLGLRLTVERGQWRKS